MPLSQSAIIRPLTFSAACLFTAAALYLFLGAGSTISRMGSSAEPVYKFEAVRGFFMQSEPGADPDDFDNVYASTSLFSNLRLMLTDFGNGVVETKFWHN